MNQRLFSLLGIGTLLLVLAVLAVNWLGPQRAASPVAEKLLPELKSELAAIDHIVLRHAGQVAIDLQRSGEHWQLVNRGNYPANVGKIRALLDNLSRADKQEAKTADPARYDKLGVAETSEKATLLTVMAGEKVVADLIVGTAVSRPAGHFVRAKNDPQSWLIDRELDVSKEASDWLRTELINLPAVKLKQVERLKLVPVQCIQAPCLPQPGERQFALSKSKPEDNEFVLSPLPAGKEKGAAWLLSGLTDGLNGLNAVDVQALATFDFSKATATLTRYSSFDDQIVLLTHYGKDGKHFVTLHQEAGPAASEEIKQAVAAFNTQHAGWVYEISSYKGEGLARDLNALVQDKKAGS
ncbi:DUF4340 domain-containing protein [Permianibacter sp. IMCC34836]|uniref:DUF4340 domain-containing protein n=1 Tax=Permianibacter fluminis TaxID=2738515 RepID=UPI0015531B90|nr:DUF4340 domain-containing protein [Permianibacter fluminis]NQD36989.1 DUF4340 domain-containing protein [Permianibacter fluminis]